MALAGVVAAAVLLLLRVTSDPPLGADPVSATVPVDDAPPVTEVGFRETEDSVGAVIVSIADFVPPYVADTLTDVRDATGAVVIVNVAVVAPAETVTLAGTLAAVLLSVNVTTTPPAGAAPLSLTVPVELLPPMTEVGLKLSVVTAGGLTVSVAVRFTPP